MMASQNVREALVLLSFQLEAPPGFEPGIKVLQTSALPLGYGATVVAPSRVRTNLGAEDGIRTRDPRLGKAMLYP